MIMVKAMREASLMQTWTNSQPAPSPLARALLCPLRSPVMRWDLVEAAELLDVDVDELAGVLAFVAPHRLGRLEVPEAAQAGALEDAADGGGRDTRRPWRCAGPGGAGGAARSPDRRRPGSSAVAGAAGVMSGPPIREPFGLEAVNPFARGARADACGACGGLRRLPALDTRAHHALSTKRRQTGIVMDVHPVLWGITELRNSSFLGPNRMNNLLKAHIYRLLKRGGIRKMGCDFYVLHTGCE